MQLAMKAYCPIGWPPGRVDASEYVVLLLVVLSVMQRGPEMGVRKLRSRSGNESSL